MPLCHRAGGWLQPSLREWRSPFPTLRRNHLSTYNRYNQFLKVSEEVREAIEGQNLNPPPVVALETAIYTHGTLDECKRVQR